MCTDATNLFIDRKVVRLQGRYYCCCLIGNHQIFLLHDASFIQWQVMIAMRTCVIGSYSDECSVLRSDSIPVVIFYSNVKC